ncbi:MAG: hypothetical protein AAFX78_03455 [Cyanobacteria bacterium J06638_20]
MATVAIAGNLGTWELLLQARKELQHRRTTMAKKPTKRQQAYTLWVQKVPMTQIAARLKVDRTTVHRWKREENWDALKESIPEPKAEEPRRPKLVSFDRGDRSARSRDHESVKIGDLNTIEGQTGLIDKLIEYALKEVASPSSPQQYSSAMNAVSKLLMERRAIAPIDRTEYMLKLQDMFRDPAELLEYLKSTGWGRRSA